MNPTRPSHEVLEALRADSDEPCRTLLTKVTAALKEGRQDFALAAWCKVHALLREGAGAHDDASSLREAAEQLRAGRATVLAAA